MQSRELPRIVTVEAQAREVLLDEEPPRRSRFAHLDFVRTPRRLDWFRLTLFCVLIGVAVSVAGLFGRWGVREAVAWLHARPKYQLEFSKIQLVPPAPEWIRGGDRTVLDAALKNWGDTPSLSVPALESDRLTNAFKKAPWVLSVVSIRVFYPNQVVVELRYREPVAKILDSAKRLVVLDEEGVILPNDELETDRVAISMPDSGEGDWLILIARYGTTDPKDRSPGVTWRTNATSVAANEADRRVLSAARLAGFFKRKERETSPQSKGLRIFFVHANEGEKPDRGLFVKTSDYSLFRWGPPPGEEAPGTVTAEDKWIMMREWAESQPRRKLNRDEDYWEFVKTGLKPHLTVLPQK